MIDLQNPGLNAHENDPSGLFSPWDWTRTSLSFQVFVVNIQCTNYPPSWCPYILLWLHLGEFVTNQCSNFFWLLLNYQYKLLCTVENRFFELLGETQLGLKLEVPKMRSRNLTKFKENSFCFDKSGVSKHQRFK